MIRLKKANIFSLTSLVLLLALAVSGCGNSDSDKEISSEASNENFTKAIQKHYDRGDKGGDSSLCVKLWEYSFPFEVESDGVNRAQYDALFEVGLLTRSEGEVKRKSSSQMVPGFRYAVTEEGQKLLVGGKDGQRVEFCFGHMKVNAIESVEKLNDEDYLINYTYLVQDVPDWMKMPVVRAAFPDVVRQVDNPQTGEARVNFRSNRGWKLYINRTRDYTTSY